ncbi:MAG: hypothetical protein AABY07_01125 [Nanoarchaeota archaeon]
MNVMSGIKKTSQKEINDIKLWAKSAIRNKIPGPLIVDYEQFLVNANLAIERAAESFDPNKSKFSTFAKNKVNFSVKDTVRELGILSRSMELKTRNSKLRNNLIPSSLDILTCEGELLLNIIEDSRLNPLQKILAEEEEIEKINNIFNLIQTLSDIEKIVLIEVFYNEKTFKQIKLDHNIKHPNKIMAQVKEKLNGNIYP